LSILKIPTAKIFEPLLQGARYKAVYGGRGSGKSHFFGELLVETCQAERGTLAVCIREAQRTLAQSSKRLIESKIATLGLGHGFKVFSDKIATPGDGIIIFRGMQDLAIYNNSDGAFYLQGFYGNPYNVPLAGGMDYWGTTVPNSSFAFPIGQAISRTTYASLFAIMGTTYGSGDGSTTFNLPDKTGRVSAMKEAAATRLTSSFSEAIQL
jgi:Phage Tail Collar Domain/Phage terminase large subunit